MEKKKIEVEFQFESLIENIYLTKKKEKKSFPLILNVENKSELIEHLQ